MSRKKEKFPAVINKIYQLVSIPYAVLSCIYLLSLGISWLAGSELWVPPTWVWYSISVFTALWLVYLWQRRDFDKKIKQLGAVSSKNMVVRKPKVALFLPTRSPTNKNTFWLELELGLTTSLNHLGCDTQPVHLENDYDEEEQARIIRSFQWGTIQGAIVSPVGDSAVKAVITVLQKQKDAKIVLHDASPERAAYFFSATQFPLSLVCIDNERGGELAAEVMFEYLIESDNTKERWDILVVPGNRRHRHSNARVRGFQDRFGNLAKQGVAWYETKDGNWTYSGAGKAFRDFCRQTKFSDRMFDGVFACNDEMADAVDAAISESECLAAIKDAVIVGFDYTRFLEDDWNKGRKKRIIGSIDAKILHQAREASQMMVDLIQEPPNEIHMVIVAPEKKVRR